MPPTKTGRPPKDPSVPPLPAGWKNTERLAVCLAYLEASEGGSTDAGALENATCRNYPAQLQHVHDNVAEFEPSSHRWSGHSNYIFTLEESKARRVQGPSLVNVWLSTRKYCVNTLKPEFEKLYNKDGSVPSGAEREQLMKKLHEALEGSDDSIEIDAAEPVAAGGIGGGGVMPEELAQQQEQAAEAGGSPAAAAAAAAKKKKKNTTYLQYFLTWEHLGPLGTKNIHFLAALPDASGKESEPPKPKSRSEMRNAQKRKAGVGQDQEQFAKGQKDAKQISELKRIRKSEEKKYLLQRQLLSTEMQKRCAEDFDQRVSRLTQRIEIEGKKKGHRKDATRLQALEEELEELLEKGPEQAEALPSDEDCDSADESAAQASGKKASETEAGEEDEEVGEEAIPSVAASDVEDD